MPCPEPQDRPDWMARLVELAAAAYRLMGIRDYGRFDFRMWGDEPQLLDVNPNPDIDVTSVIPIFPFLSVRAMAASRPTV